MYRNYRLLRFIRFSAAFIFMMFALSWAASPQIEAQEPLPLPPAPVDLPQPDFKTSPGKPDAAPVEQLQPQGARAPFTNCSNAIGISVDDCRALVALYDSTNGDSWIIKTGWLQTDAPCSWFGIGCDSGRVQSISLPGSNLTGTITPQLAALAKLEHLDLSYNALTGSIPTEIGTLTQLKYFTVLSNRLTGQFPMFLTQMTTLEHLSVGLNKLKGTIPVEIANLTNLTYLGLTGNKFTGTIPPQFGNLTQLKLLSVHGNRLTGIIPPELTNLTSLDTLLLGKNDLTGTVPAGLYNLTDLVYFDFGGNQLTGSIPPQIENLTKLKVYFAHNNQFTGVIPPEIGNLEDLEYLALGGNALTGGIPSELGDLRNLLQLDLRESGLTGQIPPELGDVASLRSLHLFGNQLSGGIPSGLGDLSLLEELTLHDNQLSGSIPATLGNLTNLKYLGLSQNQLSGEIPAALANLSGVEKINLEYNLLTASNPTLINFLNAKNQGWAEAQTVSPGGITTTFDETTSTLTVGWTPISYIWENGYYEVECEGGGDSYVARTADKSAFDTQFVGMPAGNYDCSVRTVTLPTEENQNTLTSSYSLPHMGQVTVQAPPINSYEAPEIIDNEPYQFYQVNVDQEANSGTELLPPEACAPDFDFSTAKAVHFRIPKLNSALGVNPRGGPGYFPFGRSSVIAGGPGYFVGSRALELADTIVVVYKVNKGGTLTLLECNDDAPNSQNSGSEVTFNRQADTQYRIVLWVKDGAAKVMLRTSQGKLVNGRFNLDANRDKLPDGWAVSGSKKQVRLNCSPGFNNSGPCSLQIKGVKTAQTTVSQTIGSLKGYNADHKVWLTAHISRNAVVKGGKIKVTLKYADRSLGKAKMTYDIPEGTSVDAVFEKVRTNAVLLKGRVSKLMIEISYKGKSGKLLIDDVRLHNSTASAEEVPEPEEGE